MVRPARPPAVSQAGSVALLPAWGQAGPEAAGGPAPGRLAVGVTAAAVALAALVSPKLPGHTGPVDLAMLGASFVVFVEALRSRAPVRLPYAVAVAGLVITGLLASIVSPAAEDGLIAVLQEIFLLLWCAAVTTVCRTERVLAVVLRAWALSATAWAALLVFAVAAGANAIAGTGDRLQPGSTVLQAGGGFRSRLFFDHPNMAGNYFAIAVFIVLACGCPRRPWLRAGCCAVLLVAVVLTGSNAAFGAVVVGLVATAFLHVRGRAGLIKATAVVGVLVIVLGVAAVTLGPALISYASNSDNTVLQNSLGRGTRSAENRSSLFGAQLAIYDQGNLLGIGPNATEGALAESGAAILKTAHNDYLGTLVERGPVGLLFLAVLLGSVFARVAGFTGRPPPPRLAAALPVPAALGGACAAFAFTALTHEILHYRWFWTLLGLVAAAHLLAGRAIGGADGQRAPGPATAMRPPDRGFLPGGS